MNIQIIACFIIFAGTVSVSLADIYDDPKNLKVLPEDISAEKLRETMRSFALDVGLRCSSCHQGEEGQDLKEYDFASDEKALKSKARSMLKMVTAINQKYLSEFGAETIQVNCLTCHRRVSKPLSIGQVLAKAAAADGVAAIKTSYAKLKEEFYGSGSYDFSELSLSEVARSEARAGHTELALAVLDIILDENADSFNGHFLYAELMLRADNKQLARHHLERALEINPQAAPFINSRLQQLDEK